VVKVLSAVPHHINYHAMLLLQLRNHICCAEWMPLLLLLQLEAGW
jgi:hypothetical protein